MVMMNPHHGAVLVCVKVCLLLELDKGFRFACLNCHLSLRFSMISRKGSALTRIDKWFVYVVAGFLVYWTAPNPSHGYVFGSLPINSCYIIELETQLHHDMVYLHSSHSCTTPYHTPTSLYEWSLDAEKARPLHNLNLVPLVGFNAYDKKDELSCIYYRSRGRFQISLSEVGSNQLENFRIRIGAQIPVSSSVYQEGIQAEKGKAPT
ncbi:hypothetical protein VNO77_42095 [Canavalia gladiata]|uniref:Uncharacterized protein n=1 Tax=Canavalia gladiata TaxID=3824 RepID=A0AAN9K224_CANGL